MPSIASFARDDRSAAAPVAAEDRVLVIRGKGDVFCAGLDMAERSKSAGAGEASGIEVMLRSIELCPLPWWPWSRATPLPAATSWRCIAIWWWRARRRASHVARQVGLAPNWFLAKKLMEVLGR